jgi:hypothetical protein
VISASKLGAVRAGCGETVFCYRPAQTTSTATVGKSHQYNQATFAKGAMAVPASFRGTRKDDERVRPPARYIISIA